MLTSDDLIPDRALRARDEDQFDYAAIAGRLADLVTTCDTPTNVALFGRWGSGKSSVFQLLERDSRFGQRKGKVALVRYDAWKYGGASLQRNFLSHVATRFGFGAGKEKNARFHRGLYEKRRTAELDLRALSRHGLAALVVFLVVFVALLALFATCIGLASVFTNEDFLGEIARTLPDLLASTGVVAALVAGGKLLLEGVKVDVEQSEPSADEQFSKTFKALLRRARRKGMRRFVFFVDELDRCSAQDVVATLTAIKTFLDHDDCVFVVAADRQVLEEALEALPQGAPQDANPYYSSASSFLDKIFQHQVPLPPLRGRRLTRFARDLVVARGGLWKQIRDLDQEGSLLDRVIYYLVPSHVQSPRRVKVLLNAFATNVRVIEARGIAWTSRTLEIAKLTVLQTEFPLVAAELTTEPRLPSYLLEAPATPTPRTQRLLERLGGSSTSSAVEEQGASIDAEPVDPPLSEASTNDGDLLWAQHSDLRRYLETRRDAPDPGRDLLYLEAAGAAVGLVDHALGEAIERDAPEAPETLLDRLRGEAAETLQLVARVLADMIEREFGLERKNVMQALVGVAKLLGADARPVDETIVAAVRAYEGDELVAAEHLSTLLVLSADGSTPFVQSFADQIIDRPELFESTDLTVQVLFQLDALPTTLRSRCVPHAAQLLTDDPKRFVEVCAQAGNLASELIEDRTVSRTLDSVIEADGPGIARTFYESESELARSCRRLVQHRFLLRSGPYDLVREHFDRWSSDFSAMVRTGQAILAADYAPVDDWGFWLDRVDGDQAEAAFFGDWAAFSATHFIREMAAGDASRVQFAEALPVVVPFLREVSQARNEALAAAITVSLQPRSWWSTNDGRLEQQHLHAALRPLLGAPDPEVAGAASASLATDVDRSLAGAPGQPATAQQFAGLLEMGGRLLAPEAETLLERWQKVTPADESASHWQTGALLNLALAVRRGGGRAGMPPIGMDRIVSASQATGLRNHVWKAWFALDPEIEGVASALSGRRVPFAFMSEVTQFAARQSASDRTDLLEQLIRQSADPRWIGPLSREGVDDDRLTDLLAETVESVTTVEQRKRGIEALVALRPDTPKSQARVAGLIVYLLDRETKGDFEVALKAVEALGHNHRNAGRLRSKLVEVTDRTGWRVPPKSIDALERARIHLPKKSLTDKAIQALARLTRR